MDDLSRCYKSSMRLYLDRPDILVPGRWRWCPPGAKGVPYPHLYGASVWDEDTIEYIPFGEDREDWIRTWKGTPIEGYDGQRVCGERRMWEVGSYWAERGTLQTDAMGRCLCCHPPIVEGGGDVDGGECQQEDGELQTTAGGDCESGTALQVFDGLPDEGVGSLIVNGIGTEWDEGPATGELILSGVGTEWDEGPATGELILSGVGTEWDEGPATGELIVSGEGTEETHEESSGSLIVSGVGTEWDEGPATGELIVSGEGTEASEDVSTGALIVSGEGTEASEDVSTGALIVSGEGTEEDE